MASNPLSRIDFIKESLTYNGLEASNIFYINFSVSTSPQNQYNHAWKVFCQFCQTSSSNIISDNLIISFFDHLLKNKNLKVITLLTY